MSSNQFTTWCCRVLIIVIVAVAVTPAIAEPLTPIRVSEDGHRFVRGNPPVPWRAWGVNYDHDSSGRLLDEYWIDEWETVVEDFQEIKSLGCNCVRIHLQVGKFMDARDTPNAAALAQLAKLVQLAEDIGLYLDVTGLACYHKQNIPSWYDELDEADRWSVHGKFWESVAHVCKDSPAIFCYDLMNEPILPGEEPATDWLAGELAGKHFVQRISLSLQGRARDAVADAWVNKMVDAIRKHDPKHMITVGEIPWIFVFGGGKPLFHSSRAGNRLDFVSVHFYPKKNEIDKAVKALKAYDLGKPIVIEEMFPLACTEEELVTFVRESEEIAHGWISFYWGKTSEQLLCLKSPNLGEAITASWLKKFEQLSTEYALEPPKQSVYQNKSASPVEVK
ncbi:MAG: cellulase family glycosylhydrolase [Planctomycetota bacterium]|nr:cellulase family glycosylhydrolase [Planctomycetota bacterium]